MIKLKKISLIFILTVVIALHNLIAQKSYSVTEAVEYAIKNSVTMANGELDIQNAALKVKEIKTIGLPQASFGLNYQNNYAIQRVFVPAALFGVPGAKEGDVVAAKFGTPNNGFASFSINQLIFDGSYLLGLKAADVYKELSVKSQVQNKQTIIENVQKAYYGVLVNKERIKILGLNVLRLDSLARDMALMNKQGFVEKIDLQRLEVQANNLKTEVKNIERLQELSINLLKFQMNMPINEVITLSDELSNVNVQGLVPEINDEVNYMNRPEYSILKTQQNLTELDYKNIKVGALPKVFFSFGYGYNTGRPAFGDLITKPWFSNGNFSLGTSISLWDSGTRKYKMQQSANTLQKIKNSYPLLENSIDLQVKQANISLKNGWESMQENQKNVNLATEVVKVSKLKYKQGLGTNLEVINAEAALKEAQTNYFTSLYNVLIAKVDLDKAKGTLK